MSSPIQPSLCRSSVSLPPCAFVSLPSFGPSIPSWSQSPLAGFDGVKDEKLPPIVHEIVEEDKGLRFFLEGFRFPPLVNIKDVKMSPLHVIFDLKGVFVGKEYFKLITCCLCRIA